MPADGRRKLVVLGVRDAVKAATGVDYFYDWSPAGVCEVGRETHESLLVSNAAIAARVRAGTDVHRVRGASGDVTGEFVVLLDLFVRGQGPTLVEDFEDAVADLTLAIGKAPSQGGTCTTIRLEEIGTPIYDYDAERGHYAYAQIRVAAEWDYTAGVDR